MTAVTPHSVNAIPTMQDNVYWTAVFMSSSQSNHLLEILRSTLRHVETSTEWSQEDHAVIELRRILERRIQQELGKDPEAAQGADRV